MEARQRQQNTVHAINQAQQEQQQEFEADVEPNDHGNDAETAMSHTNQNAPPPDGSQRESNTEPNNTVAHSHPESKLDKKPSASSSSLREKRVRIATPDDRRELSQAALDAFPAFYRVVEDAGADVYNDGNSMCFVIRVVPCGVVVLGEEMAWRDCDGENQMMVRLPDGWVSEQQLERIVAVPFDDS